ncbi:transglutaminase-like domain-containing protein [Paenibacillus thermotolerans]|uniref:transglutaminase-like domain-containing protein n=1 Tax=Paenibacillus thermotolerans TaxID=3027807 RepID=UPI002367EA4E|nr:MULTISPECIES: transglutaminase family protein [unclassified Paenibacillus]
MSVRPSPLLPEQEQGATRRSGGILYHTLVSVFVFLLILEWLRPLTAMAEITDIHRINPFIWSVATFLVVDALRVPGAIGWPLKLLLTAGWVGYWFRTESFFAGSWWFEIPAILSADADRLLNGSYFAISPELRTFVFLIGWAALVYAAFRIVADRGQGIWFVGATIGFLLLLQLWPGIDTNEGLLRASLSGLLMLAVLNAPKWEKASGFAFSGGRGSIAAAATAGAIVGTAVLGGGYALSASLPRQVEPVEVEGVIDWAQQFGAGNVPAALETKTGYDSYDGNLGGPITQDDSVAFIARSSKPTYWRGESKDVYTGRGWRESALTDGSEVFEADLKSVYALNGGALGAGIYGSYRAYDDRPGETVQQEVQVVDEALSQLVFAGGKVLRFAQLSARSGDSVSDIHIRHDAENGSYFVGTDSITLASYAFEAAVQTGGEEKLLLDRGTVPDDVSGRYLQLPDSLPSRVKELALEIVKELPRNRLMYVMAVQKYLHENYAYTLDTKHPPRGADFVDTFLFEDRQGYCNHFSTAMVVLLRSLGIEARWVKGFAPGAADAESGDFIVRAKDAHSWVEVYFPESGWVPFEATPGFGYAAAAAAGAGGAERTVKAVNMMLPAGLTASAGKVATANLTQNNGLGQNEVVDGPYARFAGRMKEAAARVWGEAKEQLDRAKRLYDAAAEQDPRVPPAVAGLAAIGIAAAAAPYAVKRLSPHRRPRSKTRHSRRRDAAADAALARLDLFWKRVYRKYGKRSYASTLREYVEGLPAESRSELLELVKYDECVRFGGDPGRRATRQWLDEIWRRVVSSN